MLLPFFHKNIRTTSLDRASSFAAIFYSQPHSMNYQKLSGLLAKNRDLDMDFDIHLYDLLPSTNDELARLIDRVESLGEALLDFTSIADLEAWLNHN
jgi:uncharacterized protein YaaR (DUF327 family)